MSTQSRTIILVPGAWHTAASFDVLIDTLKLIKYAGKIETIELPSVGPEPGSPILRSMLPDIEVIQRAIAAEIAQQNPILLVAHSYGSIPAGSALEKFVGSGDIKFVILAGMMLHHGESLFDLCGGTPPPLWRVEAWLTRKDVASILTSIQGDFVYANDPEHHFYNDLPRKSQEQLVTRLKSHSYATKRAPNPFEGWASVPTTYVGCIRDNAMPVPFQTLFLSRAEERGVHVEYEIIDSGHFPMISHPGDIAVMLLRLSC